MTDASLYEQGLDWERKRGFWIGITANSEVG